MAECVELGFIEKIEPYKLKSKFFPSKVGGVPAWLGLDSIPTTQELACKICGKPMIFLCQLYAPFMSKEECFHRTIYVFICKDEECCLQNNASNFKVFRCQLKRENKFYPFEPPKESNDGMDSPTASDFVKICRVCGCSGPKVCGSCKKVSYCSREHQASDWKAGHKIECQNKDKVEIPMTSKAQENLLFDEYEIDLEPEEIEEEQTDDEITSKFEELMQKGQRSTDSKDDEEERKLLFQMAAKETDHQFAKFRTQINHYPDQVIRYDKGKEPLWVSFVNKPELIPDCEICSKPRQFEFQIMPQLLVHLKVDKPGKSIDWGTVLIYSCRESCGKENKYYQETIYKQDYAPSIDFLKQ